MTEAGPVAKVVFEGTLIAVGAALFGNWWAALVVVGITAAVAYCFRDGDAE